VECRAFSGPVLPFSGESFALVNSFVSIGHQGGHFSNFLRMFTVREFFLALSPFPPDSGTTAKRISLWATAKRSAMIVPAEVLQSFASILAAGYLRFRSQRRRQNLLDTSAPQSLHGHEVNACEKGEMGDGSSSAD